MSLTLEEIMRIAHLARIGISPEQAESTLTRLNSIFTLIAQMQAIDTDGIQPMAHAQDLVQRLREDNISETNQREAFQAIAPETSDGLYLVPTVIE